MSSSDCHDFEYIEETLTVTKPAKKEVEEPVVKGNPWIKYDAETIMSLQHSCWRKPESLHFFESQLDSRVFACKT